MFLTSKYKINVVYPKLELGSKFAILDVVEKTEQELRFGAAAKVRVLFNPPF
jgi:hypothetical protein